MASANFSNLPAALAKAQIDFETATFKALLVTDVPSEAELDTWIDRADVTTEHAASGAYTTGGFAVTATLEALDTTNNRQDITFAATNPVFTSSTISAVGAIVYVSTGTAANDLLVAFVDFGATVESTNGDFSVTFSTPLRITA